MNTSESHRLQGRISAAQGFDTVKLTDGTVLVVVDEGEKDAAATIVLHHGWTQDHTSWEDVAEILATKFRVISYDARGHGRSDAGPRGSATIEQLADDLVDVIEQRVPTGPVVIAGHSLGGPVLSALVERHREFVDRRVIGFGFVATAASAIGTGFMGLPDGITRRLIPVASNAARVRALSRGRRNTRFPRIIAEAIRLGLYVPAHATWRNRSRTARQVARSHPETTATLMRAALAHDRMHILETIETPTVILAGTKDGLTPVSLSRRMAEAMPHAKLVVYAGAGHMLPYERATEVAEELAGLIESQ